ncbi:MAG: DUF1080 domain-containing protein [Candidatus Poribacteria bacterium]|nr:DUF1080 domain-containing protein [Candidatus Poribacteria bacterium]
MKLTRIVVVLLLLPLSGWAGTFIETFNDDDLKEWQELVQQDEKPGTWEVINRELHAVSPDPWPRLLTIGNKKWRDYTIEVDVKPIEKHGRASIVIAARIKGTRLVFCEIGDRLVPGWDALCRTGDFHTNTSVLLSAGPHPLLKMDDWSTLKLSVKEGTFVFSINDEKIAETADDFALVLGGRAIVEGKVGRLDDFLTGGAGFGLANYTAKFDNLIITGKDIPNKGTLPVVSRGKLATTWGHLKRF